MNINDDCKVVCATIAFEWELTIKCWVIHYNLPKKHRRVLSGNLCWSRWFAIRNRIIRKLWRDVIQLQNLSQGLNAEVQLAARTNETIC
jgi:hypothetical protein